MIIFVLIYTASENRQEIRGSNIEISVQKVGKGVFLEIYVEN